MSRYRRSFYHVYPKNEDQERLNKRACRDYQRAQNERMTYSNSAEESEEIEHKAIDRQEEII